ncbi:MAG: radical SAM protein [Muribaculaceae bacterium]|nr:radical SAM protein [Muribaculaceae bacterium]
MYRVNEIFHSLQGEGYHTGTASVFIRLSGCNLRCTFCDTDHQHGTLMSLPEIVEKVNQYRLAPLIVLTGGEPSLWIDDNLVNGLKALTGKRIAIETNGTRPLPAGIDWVTLSPKGAFEGGDIHPCILDHCDELKVVYTGQDLAQYDHIQATHRFLQPCYCDDPQQRAAAVAATVEAVLAHPTWRLSLQTHRILQIP